MRLVTTAIAVLAAALIAAPTAQAAAKPAKLPTLLAKAPGLAKRVALPLDAADFAPVKQTRPDRLTLRWPAKRPCVTTTFRLTITPGQTDPVALVRAAVPDADREKVVSGPPSDTPITAPLPLPAFAPFAASRRASDIVDSEKLRVHGVAAVRVSDRYGDAKNALVVLHMNLRTVQTDLGPCYNTNAFATGPTLSAFTAFGG